MTPIIDRGKRPWLWLAKWLIMTCQFIWPWLEKQTPKQEQGLRDDIARDENRIDALDFSVEGEIALEEARRLTDSEAERRRGTDQKAATYLPLVAALIPLVLTVVSALWEKKTGSAPNWLNMLLLALAVAYTAAAGRWAFKELKVAVSHEPGLSDFEKAWAVPHPQQALARRLLLHTRRNREGVNWKVTCIIMAHEYLLRAFLTFSLLLLVNIGWYLAGLILHAWFPTPVSMITTPRQALAVVSEVDQIARQLQTADAWTVLDNDCRRRSSGGASLSLSPEAVAPLAKIPAILRPAASETGAVRNIRLNCSGRTFGQLRAWFVPARLIGLKRSPGLPDPLALPATGTVIAVKQNWPSADDKDDMAKLPSVLIQQSEVLRDGDGRPIALVVTAIIPAAVLNR
jgi:hypothetical protein